MVRTVFADAGYWIALSTPRDEHRMAQDVARQLAPLRIVTTEMVLVEFLTFMSRRGRHGRERAAHVVKELISDPYVEVVPQTSAQFEAALDRYASRLDQRWSLTDCASFLLMEEMHISEALAHDRDFQQAGFIALLRG